MYELAQSIRESNEIQTVISRLETRANELHQSIREQGQAPIPAPVFTMYKCYLDDLRQQNKSASNSLYRAEKKVDAKRDKLVQASVDRKIMERFKEIQYQNHHEVSAREEQNNLDELAALAAARRDHES